MQPDLFLIVRKYIIAVIKQSMEVPAHVDCCCQECKDIRAYLSLGMWQKRKANRMFNNFLKGIGHSF